MKNVGVFICFLSLLLLSGCITVAPPRMDDDGSSRVTTIAGDVLLEEGGFVIRELDVAGVEALKQRPVSDIYLWAPWCAGCIADIKYRFDEKFAPSGDREVIFISTNYDLKNIRKYLSGKVREAYVLSAASYGTDEQAKAAQCSRQLSGKARTGMPQRYQFRDGAPVTQ